MAGIVVWHAIRILVLGWAEEGPARGTPVLWTVLALGTALALCLGYLALRVWRPDARRPAAAATLVAFVAFNFTGATTWIVALPLAAVLAPALLALWLRLTRERGEPRRA